MKRDEIAQICWLSGGENFVDTTRKGSN